jgi:hypothetical protein
VASANALSHCVVFVLVLLLCVGFMCVECFGMLSCVMLVLSSGTFLEHLYLGAELWCLGFLAVEISVSFFCNFYFYW